LVTEPIHCRMRCHPLVPKRSLRPWCGSGAHPFWPTTNDDDEQRLTTVNMAVELELCKKTNVDDCEHGSRT